MTELAPHAAPHTKGILLSGGSGTRLYPMTQAASKQLLPVYDKPMIFYPLSTLILAGIREIMIITTPTDMPQFQRLLGDGSAFGVEFTYRVQQCPEGIAQAFLIAEDWLKGSHCALALGDNLIFADRLEFMLLNATRRQRGATVFSYQVRDPERYGVVTFDEQGKALDIVEKPEEPESNWAVTGLYFYDDRVCEMAHKVTPSPRGELEITDLNRMYLAEGTLHVDHLDRGCAWLDAGTPDSLMQAGTFVQAIQSRQGLLVGSPTEAAFRMGFLSAEKLRERGQSMAKTELGRMLLNVAEGNKRPLKRKKS
ncbi:glucose-1-phosphate thymidylyltransferase RfbA [Saccharibacter floricola]|uniref:Glucose-1-phosphate thymidylyltransferase n=1 Tax=Saccharibacter floricola DSM 15669 TaxID=1123227 RepID=A0ABQ0NWL3_9PROT|nr:glucose-1-phosphate thymidylyltransferase RfbA [Saccharibacter floricola]GBQ05155.1 glucose-1-phosphate thymidylyltransferase [Saccharibacter floricola DSM 15669]